MAKTNGLSCEPTRRSCDHCQRMFNFDSCQSNHSHTDGSHNWQASVKLCKMYCDNWHRLTWSVCTGGLAGVRYVITKFSRTDSLPNFVTHGAALRALRARESSAIRQCKHHVVFTEFWDLGLKTTQKSWVAQNNLYSCRSNRNDNSVVKLGYLKDSNAAAHSVDTGIS